MLSVQHVARYRHTCLHQKIIYLANSHRATMLLPDWNHLDIYLSRYHYSQIWAMSQRYVVANKPATLQYLYMGLSSTENSLWASEDFKDFRKAMDMAWRSFSLEYITNFHLSSSFSLGCSLVCWLRLSADSPLNIILKISLRIQVRISRREWLPNMPGTGNPWYTMKIWKTSHLMGRGLPCVFK